MGINNLKIDDIVETYIEGLENEASGVAKVNGMIVFIPKTLVGEKVKIRITEIKKNFAKGKLIEVLEPSKNRITSRCPYYGECGGCNLRHQSSEQNLVFKKEKVQNALKRIGRIETEVKDTVSSFKEDNYRNKISLKVENNKIGFYGESTYQLIDIDYCFLADELINDTLKIIKSYIEDNKNKISSITIKYGNALNEILVDISSNDNNDIKIADYLINNSANIKTIIFNDNVIYGDGYIRQICNGYMFDCSSKSFFQVNSVQTEKLYKLAISSAKLSKNDVVLDLYCGTGTISSIVSGYVKKVIGIEIVPDAILDAKRNLKNNNINNVKFICGDATKEISKIKEKIDVIIVDPPRKGVDRKAISIIKKIKPKKIVYISCNPVTMARDLSYLNDEYEINSVSPVDMFPNTSHVECVSVLHSKILAK